MASPHILNRKKKKITEKQKIQPSRRWQRNQIGGRKSIPQCPILPIEQIKLNSKPNSTANQTQSTQRETQRTQRDRGFYLKKKKIPNTQIKTKPQQTHGHVAATPQLARRRRRRSPLIPDRRSAFAPVLPPTLPQGISLFFSLSLYLTVTKMKNETKFL